MSETRYWPRIRLDVKNYYSQFKLFIWSVDYYLGGTGPVTLIPNR